MKDDKINPEINIEELERTIINGEKEIKIDEVNMLDQYKSELARLSSQFGVELTSDEGNLSEQILRDRSSSSADPNDSWIAQQTSRLNDMSPVKDFPESSNHFNDTASGGFIREPSLRSSVFGDSGGFSRDTASGGFSRDTASGGYDNEGIRNGNLDDYRFQSSGSGRNIPQYADDFIDPYAQNMTQEQQKRRHLQHMFNNIGSQGRMPMGNYDLTADREYEDKQMLLSAIDDIRDDLQQIGVDISRIKEVDNNSSMAEIREVHNKLIYKNNSNNYSNFADELFLLGAQAAEYMFDGEKEWFGHKPDLTGWSNTVRGKLRRMRYTKTQIVRKIVDDYQIPPWLQIGFEIIPSAFTHSRHRKTAVRGDSVVHNSAYQNAIHDLNNIMD